MWRKQDTKRVLYSIIAANVGVSLLWRIPALQGFMLRNAVLQLPPLRTRPWTFLTSNFSHAGTLHLAVNMLALSSFGSVVAEDFGAYHFAAFYLSAGLASSMTAYLARLRRGSGGRSLGASGAVYACFAATALMHPDAQGAFIFLPGIPIRLGDLLPLLMCFDAAGVLLGWRYLDHFGHLGGALFGIFYTKMPSDDYFPSFDLRDLSTVEELEWATGGLDVTAGKEVELNVFSRDRLEDLKAQVASVSAVESWPERLQKGTPPPPLPQYMPPSAMEEYMASSFL
ncbi:rhomboid-domain-containing protein [Coccomyxa subellipsoidea C-169]|uniref:Rhomboid-domain-containing protein n=1 Tax=Coccomyxa subellipsoidea (strain C-169) TaxID=574566 RepID=I0Z4M1_COCSC|nr:rhomboid-domain-containing protein [Coccomyxa subellipsoidea C-169]EIE25590.1 rhomboid-domain-containing protein [Coccomyxa subellipsoidea C-169]|eukprot:XP_005650134.1 rhomboid-domain-containing protein [Coccomyxa subellipsoidea C-169]